MSREGVQTTDGLILAILVDHELETAIVELLGHDLAALDRLDEVVLHISGNADVGEPLADAYDRGPRVGHQGEKEGEE